VMRFATMVKQIGLISFLVMFNDGSFRHG